MKFLRMFSTTTFLALPTDIELFRKLLIMFIHFMNANVASKQPQWAKSIPVILFLGASVVWNNNTAE